MERWPRLGAGLIVVAAASLPWGGCGETGGADAPHAEATPPAPRDSFPPPVFAASEVDAVVGTWHLDRGRARELARLWRDEEGRLTGVISDEVVPDIERLDPDEELKRFEVATWDPTRGRLTASVPRGEAPDTERRWYALTISEGVLRGRVAYSKGDSNAPPSLASFAEQVVGWRAETFDGTLGPRTYDLETSFGERALVRLDVDPMAPPGVSAFVGQYKVYERLFRGVERPALELQILHWDGEQLRFVAPFAEGAIRFVGRVRGRHIEGTLEPVGPGEPGAFSGTRAEVLAYGLAARSAEARARWQDTTRRRLQQLLMAGQPTPTSLRGEIMHSEVPLSPDALPPGRDDDPARWASGYSLTELRLYAEVPHPAGAPPFVRPIHAWIAWPEAPRPPDGFPVLVALNGHGGSAARLFDASNDLYWYGDGFARRGFVVLAVDISHRPGEDSVQLYAPHPGDDPERGNGPHAAIRFAGLDSDWVEDGERAFDVLRGLDYVLSLPGVNRTQITVAGLSLGASIAQLVGALDERVTSVIAAGFVPELPNLVGVWAHECWRWIHGDVREYVDFALLHALIAPRRLVIETGVQDQSASWLGPVPDKEVVRRGRVAYADAPDRLVHYVHPGGHIFRFGEREADGTILGVTVPLRVQPEAIDGAFDSSGSWALDPRTVALGVSLPDLLAGADVVDGPLSAP